MFLNLASGSKKILRYLGFLLIIFSPFFAEASSVEVKDIRFWSSENYTRVVVDLTNTVEFLKNRLSNPDRLYFDVKDAHISKEINTSIPVGDGILKTVRASQFNKTTVRVVLDLDEISDYQTFIFDDPARLVIDVYGKTRTADKPDMNFVKRRIVLDPGHGGHDPGAVGPKNLYEKDVVLDIALKLKKVLMEDPFNEVFLTRERDIFIPLEERTAMANKKNADLFVSIHANASPRREAKGIETYLLNWTDDEEAIRVAARENAISLKKMRAMNRQVDIVDVIKSDLIRENKRDESIKLANYIQRSLISNLDSDTKHVLNLGVKQALFYVLFGAKMPSVLVEVSFISNPEEERLLSNDAYRTEIAKGIAKGLNTYLTSAPTVQKVVEFRDHPSFFR
ncbi:MAG TPA: N-acetylmuramoyl-L-alanine amidase [Thermodesulfovibrionales bacterium]|nr:N-acetylmuramoyl-L-alanine amidase [Thermodesulfovibrionales bacterium]